MDGFLDLCTDVPLTELDPNRGMDAVRSISGPVAVSPALVDVPIDDKRMYPIYAKCVELDVPIVVSTGVPRELVRYAPQEVGRVDEVCWFFPDLKLVMRDGGEPWTDLAVKLLLKWPNLYYATSRMLPTEYPAAIVDFANTRGAGKVMFASDDDPDRRADIVDELHKVPFRDEVWPKFLHENLRKVFG